jgi:hypothetical protein
MQIYKNGESQRNDIDGKTEELGEKPVPVPLSPPQIPQTDPSANTGLLG